MSERMYLKPIADRYLSRIPKPWNLSAGTVGIVDVHGHVVVHNHVRPTRHLGSRGFRAWLQSPDKPPAIEPCPCDWAPELGEHYRVRRADD